MFLSIATVCVLFLGQSVQAEMYKSGDIDDEGLASQFLKDCEKESLLMCKKASLAHWEYNNNLTDTNKQYMLKVNQEYSLFEKELWKNATRFSWKTLQKSKPKMYRMFKMLALLGDSALPENKVEELNTLVADMSTTYSKAKICNGTSNCENPTLELEPELTAIMAESTDYEELKRVWVDWREATGKKMKNQFLKYVDLKNEAALLNGFQDAGELWLEAYEVTDFKEQMEKLWLDLRPFYAQLHAFVRRMLRAKYPDQIRVNGPIPAHLLGNMWAQTWDNIYDQVQPYPNETKVDATDKMKEKDMTPHEMFEISEEFFTSLGLIPMTPEFWNNSVIEKPSDREIVCHASAWDFCDGKDVRIKMCTRVNMEDLITVHHEMGHIEYYLQYAKQPLLFRNGANPGFHEAVGDVLALSVSTPSHLKKIGLLEEVSDSDEADINYLLKMALGKVAFLPFAYSLDLWRWNVFSGNISRDELNARWWDLRLKNQGLCPPVERTEEDFDPASKYHVIAGVPYIRYFVSFVIQFQFHKALCQEAGHVGPLHKCDIYKSKDAGHLLSEMLSLGNSVPWNEAMSIMMKGKTDKMDASGILEYFDPLIKWLKEQNQGETIGWQSDNPNRCP